MRHGSLFSGIGGFDLAAQWMDWENVFHCEIDPFCQRILRYYWPQAKTFTDIKTSTFTEYAGKIDILTGGFPCQPYSQSGKRLGKADERHLWPEMLRSIQEISPRWIVGENVRGIINWNRGVVFNEVQTDLEAAGYEVLPFLLPAYSVNADHERYRIFFVAHSKSRGFQKEQFEHGISSTPKDKRFPFRVSSNPWGGGDLRSRYPLRNGVPGELDVDAVFEGVKRNKRSNAVTRWRNESIRGGGQCSCSAPCDANFQGYKSL